MSLLITHILLSLLSIFLIAFLFWYNKQLKMNNSNLKKFWLNRSQNQYNFMKFSSLFMIFAFVFILLNNIAKIIILLNS